MSPDVFFTVFSAVLAIGALLGGAFVGKEIGRTSERRRCARLCTETYRRGRSIDDLAMAVIEGFDKLADLDRPTMPTVHVRCEHRNRVPSSAGEFCADCGAEL